MSERFPFDVPAGYRLRRATLLDVRAVHRMEQLIFPRDAYTFVDLVLLFLWPYGYNLKITAPDGALAGFIAVARALDLSRGWIVTVGVVPAHQRRGVGAALLEAAEHRLRRRFMLLTVREGNTPAIRLYKRTGYQVLRRAPGYYRDGETGLVMQKDLAAPDDADEP